MPRVSFVCIGSGLRSPTAEHAFSIGLGLETNSAWPALDADCPLSADQIEWDDIICVMETRHPGAH